MKKYIKPKISSIELDPEQAILNVCAVGGIFMLQKVSPSIYWCITRTGTYSSNCLTSIRGVAGQDILTLLPPTSSFPS
jgi:hypothetical protein